MATVPVFVPSYEQSGDTHVVDVGDRVSWELAAVDAYLPPHLVRPTDAIAEPAESPLPSLNYYPTLVRQGDFVAWWDADEPVTGRVQLRLLFRIGDSRLPEDGVPPSRGVVTQMYCAFDLLRQRPDGPWDSVPGLGVVEVTSTEVWPAEGFTAYFPDEGVDVNDGQWRHVGWVAMLRCD